MIWVKKDLGYSEKFHESIWKLRNYIKNYYQEIKEMNVGKYDYSHVSDGVVLMISEYETKDTARLESHKKYVDLQMLLKGQEIVLVSDISTLNEIEAYNEEKDIIFWEGQTQCSMLLEEGNMIILLPNEGHAPCLNPASGKCLVKKAVFKIPYL